jgi:gamma-glutamyltranspeptidase/glutathione hydrolase
VNPKTAAVATPHPAAAEAARTILLLGGNAVDAAVAAMLASCVVVPGSVGIGGYGGSLIAYLAARQKVVAIDFDSRAPLAFRPELFAGNRSEYELGYRSISVPAVVAGLAMALEELGTLPWQAVTAPAIALAEDGVQVSQELQQQLHDWAKKADSVSLRALFPDGAVTAVGATWRQRDLAKLLKRLSAEGPGSFYEGDIPRTIVRQVLANGGILTEEDFARYRPALVEPLAIDYRDYRVLTPPPPSGGLTSLQVLKTLEQFDLSRLQPWGAEYFHLFVEAAKPSWQDRAKYLADPDGTQIPIARLLSRPNPEHTVNVVAADTAGNVVSITATHGQLYGSTVVIDGLGLIMGHGMSRFDLAPDSPNTPAAGKRMQHNMSPTLILGRDGRPHAAIGTPGGTKIVTLTAQLVVSLIDFRTTPAEVVTAGRVHVEADEPLTVSPAVSDSVIQELRDLGHTVERAAVVNGIPQIGGPANALVIDPSTGAVSVASQAGETAAIVVSTDDSGALATRGDSE